MLAPQTAISLSLEDMWVRDVLYGFHPASWNPTCLKIGSVVNKLTNEAMVLSVTGNFVFFVTFLIKRSIWV
jgi:hypothetical protein